MTALFETMPCRRCGGSGKYSYNSMDGNRCYGCYGQGVQLTKRGALANAHYRELCTKPAYMVEPGWNMICSVGIAGPDRWHFVKAIEADELNPGRLHFELWRKGKHATGYGMCAGTHVRAVRDQAELDEIKARALAYQATLPAPGERKPRKSRAKRAEAAA